MSELSRMFKISFCLSYFDSTELFIFVKGVFSKPSGNHFVGQNHPKIWLQVCFFKPVNLAGSDFA